MRTFHCYIHRLQACIVGNLVAVTKKGEKVSSSQLSVRYFIVKT